MNRFLNRMFADDNIHHIHIPRGRLALLFLLLLALESAVLISWRGVFIIVAVFLCIPLSYLTVLGCRIWRRYYALAWYPVCVLLVTAAAVAVRLLVYRILL